ncbi:MAG: dihydroxyacetone kinase subunit DhaL, partial [Acidobacteriota bacterium]|nr:dihydroxyacetone kinase subunit DhaL [Acidobacteriota bacterium]
DDIALAATQERVLRRGIAGTVLVHKIAGAAAAEGKALEQVTAVAQAAADDIATMGVSLSAGVVPAVGKPGYELGEREVELGLGIHGEPGVRRMELKPADEIVDEIAGAILQASPLGQGQRIVLLVNNLGATTLMELAIVARRALSLLHSRGVVVERVYAGTFVSSLEAAGLSLSVMKVDDERLRLLDAPTSAPAWPNVLAVSTGRLQDRIFVSGHTREKVKSRGRAAGPIHPAIRAACQAVISAEEHLTELDQAVGDGDLGISLARGGRAVLEEAGTYSVSNWAETFRTIGLTLQRVLGGSSGPLYGVLFLRLGTALEDGWAPAFLSACEAVSSMGGAVRGDRTMLDALIPFAETFRNYVEGGKPRAEALKAALDSAEKEAAETSAMMPRRGRSSYLGERALGHPDPGAIAVTIWLRAAVTGAISNAQTSESGLPDRPEGELSR